MTDPRINLILARLDLMSDQLTHILLVMSGNTQAVQLLNTKEDKIMAIGDDILAKVTEEDTALDSLIAFLQGLEAQGVIPAGTAQAILAKSQGSIDKINAALTTNVPPVTL